MSPAAVLTPLLLSCPYSHRFLPRGLSMLPGTGTPASGSLPVDWPEVRTEQILWGGKDAGGQREGGQQGTSAHD